MQEARRERLCASIVRQLADQRGRAVASKADDYRRRAKACMVMAATMASAESRASFVEMAQVWTRLADEENEAFSSPPAAEQTELIGREHGQQQQQQQQQIQPETRKGE
jgi:hypothetical protein